jgi:hypothetical protein
VELSKGEEARSQKLNWISTLFLLLLASCSSCIT